jgi:hypothetical protein
MMKRLMLGMLVAGCASNEYSEGGLHLRWKPPDGVKLQAEATEGKVTTATFSGGVEVRSVAAPPLAAIGDLEALKASLLTGAGLKVPGEVRVSRTSSIPAGPTVRWEMAADANRSLLLYVPGKERYVVISLVAPAAVFARKSDKLELSLSTLQLQ